jgi:hypothetical protein
MCRPRSLRKSIIDNKRVRPWRPDSNPELSGEPGAVQSGILLEVSAIAAVCADSTLTKMTAVITFCYQPPNAA